MKKKIELEEITLLAPEGTIEWPSVVAVQISKMEDRDITELVLYHDSKAPKGKLRSGFTRVNESAAIWRQAKANKFVEYQGRRNHSKPFHPLNEKGDILINPERASGTMSSDGNTVTIEALPDSPDKFSWSVALK